MRKDVYNSLWQLKTIQQTNDSIAYAQISYHSHGSIHTIPLTCEMPLMELVQAPAGGGWAGGRGRTERREDGGKEGIALLMERDGANYVVGHKRARTEMEWIKRGGSEGK